MKTIILISLFVYILLPLSIARAEDSCSTGNNTSEMAKAFAKYCKLHLYTFEKTNSQSYASSLKTKLEAGSSPMTCKLKANVYECKGAMAGSSEPVRIYFKSDLKKPNRLAIHLHGFNVDSDSNPFSAVNGNYAQMLQESNSETVLVVPESKGLVATYKKDFATGAQWSKWISNVENKLGLDSKIPINLSAHSGSDYILNSVGSYCDAKSWDCSRIKSVGLFDANYGKIVNGRIVGRDGLRSLVSYVAQNQGTIFIRDTEVIGLAPINKILVSGIDSKRLNVNVVKTKHMAIMKDGGFSNFLEY